MTATDTDTDRREIDAYAIALDETEHYNIAPADAPFIERIEGMYLFDRNERTHCCELTPSYFLIYLYTAVYFKDEVRDTLTDARRDEIEQDYCYEPSDDIYVHCASIERIVKEGRHDRISHYGDVAHSDLEDGINDADERHSAEMEAIREDLASNCPF